MSLKAVSSSYCAHRDRRVLDLLAAFLKALGYSAALSAAGVVLARTTLGSGSDEPALARIERWAGIGLTVTACCTAVLFVLRLGGELDPATIDAVFLSRLGASLGLQLIGGLWLACFAGRRASLPGALLVLLAFGVVGHSATVGPLASVTIIAHVTAVAWWLGGLWILLFSSRKMASESFAQLVGRFSRQADWMVVLLFAAALTTAAMILNLRFDPGLNYDRGLMAKFGLTIGLLALAAVNKLLLSPWLAEVPHAITWIRRTILGELLLFALIIATTAWLTTYQSPHEADHARHGSAEELQVEGPIGIANAWAPATIGSHGTGAGYMVIINNQSADDRLIGVKSDWADHVSLHASIRGGDVARMRELAALPVPAGQRIALAPGARHLMFTGLYSPFVAGDAVPVTLMFERAGEIEITLGVRPLGGLETHEH